MNTLKEFSASVLRLVSGRSDFKTESALLRLKFTEREIRTAYQEWLTHRDGRAGAIPETNRT